MPELPEVNTLSLALDKQIRGDMIVAWKRLSPKLRRVVPGSEDVLPLLDRRIEKIFRVGKSIYFAFADSIYLHVHLGMTGCFCLWQPEERPMLSHEHLRLELGSGRTLSYCDSRRFGVVELVDLPRKSACEPFAGLLSVDYLVAACNGSTRSIKTLVMDQDIIAGLGNIYACEALFVAQILPFREAGSLSRSEIQGLVSAIISVIAAAIRSGEESLGSR
jgi:formamidopyrimidine-DNA glycosylase